MEKSKGISGYLNEGTSTHLFKTSVRVNMHYFDSSFSKTNVQTDTKLIDKETVENSLGLN